MKEHIRQAQVHANNALSACPIDSPLYPELQKVKSLLQDFLLDLNLWATLRNLKHVYIKTWRPSSYSQRDPMRYQMLMRTR